MENRNLRNYAAAFRAAERLLLRRAPDDVSSTLVLVGFVTCATAAVSRPAVSMLGTLAVSLSLIGGLSTLWAAGWVAGDPVRRRAAGLKMLFASLFPMAMAIGLDPESFFGILGAIA